SYLRSVGDEQPEEELARSSKEIETRLTRPVSVSFQKFPVQLVCRDLQALSGIRIVLDTTALSDAGIGLDQPLSLQVENISMKSVLNLLLKQVNLTYQIKDDVIVITPEAWNIGRFPQVTYPIAKYLGGMEPDKKVDQLIKLITNTIAPDSWESAGGPGRIQYLPNDKTLVITQVQD